VAVDEREVAGAVVRHAALPDLEPRPVDVRRAVRERADESVVRALIPAQVLHRDQVDAADGRDREDRRVGSNPSRCPEDALVPGEHRGRLGDSGPVSFA
jgi:hypothetical protein